MNKVLLLFLLPVSILLSVGAISQEVKTKKSGKTERTSKPGTQDRKTDNVNNKPSPQRSSLAADIRTLYETAQEVTEKQPGREVNWTQQYIEATGESVIDTVKFKNRGQARAMAIRGATLVAQRNLLETINGVKINGETTVENLMTTQDYVYSRIDGVLKGAEMVGEPREEWGMMKVTMKVPLYRGNGLAPAVIDAIKNRTSHGMEEDLKASGDINPEELSEIVNYVFDVKDNSFDPSMFPVIVDEQGNILVDLTSIYDPSKGNFPKLLKASREILEQVRFKEGVEVIDVISASNGKLVVNDIAKKKVNWDKVAATLSVIGKMVMAFI